jgi:hypothetical protein
VVGGTLAEALGRSLSSSSARTAPSSLIQNNRVQIQKPSDPSPSAEEQCHAGLPDPICSGAKQCHAWSVLSPGTGTVLRSSDLFGSTDQQCHARYAQSAGTGLAATAGTGGLIGTARHGPWLLNGPRRGIRRTGKLADRFLRTTADIDAINLRTLAVIPYTVRPSYAQVVAGMAAARTHKWLQGWRRQALLEE